MLSVKHQRSVRRHCMCSKVLGEALTALCFTANIPTADLKAWDFMEVPPRREFTTWESSLPFEEMCFVALGIARRSAVAWEHPGAFGSSSPTPGEFIFKNKPNPGPAEGPATASAGDQPGHRSRHGAPRTRPHSCPPALGPGQRFLLHEQQPSELFWGGKACFTPQPEPAWVSHVRECSRGPGLRDFASPSRPESKQS